ncbi:hypothetical protein BD770DRAFT_432403 [Pilaira anomala]|nr:hypothetical protein BD770DRAFT_432403 [Pilaira anomala]
MLKPVGYGIANNALDYIKLVGYGMPSSGNAPTLYLAVCGNAPYIYLAVVTCGLWDRQVVVMHPTLYLAVVTCGLWDRQVVVMHPTLYLAVVIWRHKLLLQLLFKRRMNQLQVIRIILFIGYLQKLFKTKSMLSDVTNSKLYGTQVYRNNIY